MWCTREYFCIMEVFFHYLYTQTWCAEERVHIFLLAWGLRAGTDQIRSDYISSSHTRLIRCLTHHLMQASIDKPDNSN